MTREDSTSAPQGGIAAANAFSSIFDMTEGGIVSVVVPIAGYLRVILADDSAPRRTEAAEFDWMFNSRTERYNQRRLKRQPVEPPTMLRPRSDTHERAGTASGRRLVLFFIWVFVLSVPFWFAGETGQQLMPGLPLSALTCVCPAIAAVIVCYQTQGASGLLALFASAGGGTWRRRTAWSVIAFLVPLSASAASFGVLRFTASQIPAPHIEIGAVLVLCGLFFCAALAEELGWTAFATSPLQERFGLWRAGLILGSIWAVWHFIPLLQAHRTWTWIAWWSLGTVAARLIMIALWNFSGRSTLVTSVFHMSVNVCWQLFPVHGSYFDPRSNALILLPIAVAFAAIAARRQ